VELDESNQGRLAVVVVVAFYIDVSVFVDRYVCVYVLANVLLAFSVRGYT
jgi:hypothetical protein